MAADKGRVEPCPRRIRGFLDGETVFDTTRALYVWEWEGYPQYYIPEVDVHGKAAALQPVHGTADLAGTVRFEWEALDAWFEEDEEVFVHPRNPYTRVDALRSHRLLRVEIDGVVLAETRSPVMVYETGLPTRYYVDRTDVRFQFLRPSTARSSCPYKGDTSAYWSVEIDGARYPDVAWSYDFPTRALTPIAGLVAFLNEEVDLFLNGQPLRRESAPASSRRTR